MLRNSALTLSYSTAEYACPVWECLTHVKRPYPCRLIPGCLKSTNVDNLHLLPSDASTKIWREAANKLERSKQVYDSRQMLFNQSTPSRLESRNRLSPLCRTPDGKKISTWRNETWKRKLEVVLRSTRLSITPERKWLPESSSEWATRRCLNRLRIRVARTKTELKEWDFIDLATKQFVYIELTITLCNTD